MEEYTREQIQRADDTDLYVFLSGRGEQFKRCGKEYRWLRHDSVWSVNLVTVSMTVMF